VENMLNEKSNTGSFDLSKKAYRKTYEHWLRFHLKYAALLHDIGHAPLSHIGEYFYERDQIKEEIKTIIQQSALQEYIKINDRQLIDLKTYEKGSPHEWMSCYIILKHFRDCLTRIYNNIKERDAKSENLGGQNPALGLEIDFGFIIRIITGNIYKGADIGNAIIRLINNDKTIDVDRLDYALRDNYMVGNIGSPIDIKRLFNSIYLNKKKYDIIFKTGALSSLKNYIDCRDSIYMWVCNHHLVVYTDFLYKEALKKIFEIQKEKEEEGLQKYKKKDDLFSCNAIIKKMPTDNEIHCLLRDIFNDLSDKKTLPPEKKYLINLLKQLYERTNKFTPLYKTRKGYMDLLVAIDKGDIYDIDKELNKIIEGDKFKDFLQHVKNFLKTKKINFKDGDFLVLKKANKDLKAKEVASIKIYDNGKENLLTEYISPRNHADITDITIFIYYKQNRKNTKKIEKNIPLAIEYAMNLV
jgi:HD superfamily phosphohydrolase